jgi:hypothetical protein
MLVMVPRWWVFRVRHSVDYFETYIRVITDLR